MPEPIDLSSLEKIALSGLVAKEQILKSEYSVFLRLLEAGHELQNGDIGATYLLDVGTGKLVPKPTETKTPES